MSSNERVQCNTEFVDGEVCIDNMQQVVHTFNDCFVNLGPGLAEQITLQSAQHREYLNGDYLSSMFLEPALEDEVIIIILNLKNSSPGWDDLKPDIIKHVCQYITLPVTHIIVNLSLENGILSWELKKAKVIPKNKLYVLYKNQNSVYNEIKYKRYKNKLQNVI